MTDHTDSRDKKREGNSNALKHSMYAKAFLLPEEDREEFTVLRRALQKDWRPQGATEVLYFTNIVQWAWNLIRVNRWIRDRRALEHAVHVPFVLATEADAGSSFTLIERVTHHAATVAATRTHTATLKWLREAVKNADDHIALNRLLREIQKAFGLDALLLRQEAAPQDLAKRKEFFQAYIVSELEPKLEQFIASELAESGRVVRENIQQTYATDVRADIESLARCHAEYDKAIRRFMQYRASRDALKTIEG
jgi:hypothetical protein